MKIVLKWSLAGKLLITFLLLNVFYSCKKSDQAAPSTPDLQLAAKSPKQSEESAEMIYQWYKFMANLQLMVNPQPSPFVQNRAFAYIGVGLFEAVQPGIKGGSSFGAKLYEMPAMPKPDMSKEYCWRASANAAIASLAKLLVASLSVADKASIDAKELANYNQLRLTTPEDVLKRSEAFGRSIALAIYNWSTTDNFSITSEGYSPPNVPWAWSPTPPGFAAPVGANLQFSRPMLRYTLDANAPPIPIPFSTIPGSQFYQAVQEVHDLGGTTTATPANKATANWWADAGGPGTGLPAPYHILSIVTSMLESHQSGLWKAAEVYAKAGIAVKDGPIITFRAKYQYSLLRPITYIRQHISANWLSHLTTPPYPEYTSGLVSFYGPVVQVLINEFGDIAFTDNAYLWKGLPVRQYSSLSQMLHEAAISRVYAGIHYRFTQLITIDMGVQLGNEIDKVRVVGPEYK